MNDPEDFLTRWSRRKRKADDDTEQRPDGDREQDAADAQRREPAAEAAPRPSATKSETTEPLFDLSKLPPIESITAETDIRGFLAPGVPADVRLAALRRAWAADPKVRDFVGLNDYDFDFHTPGAIPGFGALEMTDELRQEVIRIVSAGQPAPEAGAPAPPVVTAQASEPAISAAQPPGAIEEINARPNLLESAATENSGAGPDHPAADQGEVITDQATTHRNEDSVASQQKHSRPENLQTLARRGHGGALPK